MAWWFPSDIGIRRSGVRGSVTHFFSSWQVNQPSDEHFSLKSRAQLVPPIELALRISPGPYQKIGAAGALRLLLKYLERILLKSRDIALCRGVGLWGGTSLTTLFRLYISLGTGVLHFVGGFCPEILIATSIENKNSIAPQS